MFPNAQSNHSYSLTKNIFENSFSATIPKERRKRKNVGGRPKSIVWETHATQDAKVSEGHYEATCVYCNHFWNKGSPQDLEAHFANECPKIPADTRQFFLNRLATKAEGDMGLLQ